MTGRILFARYLGLALGIAAGLQWLLLWTISRLAAAPTLVGTPRDIIEAIGRAGVFLISPAFLLAVCFLLLVLLESGARSVRERNPVVMALSILLGVFVALAGVHAVAPTQVWLNVLLNLVAVAAILGVGLAHLSGKTGSLTVKLGVLLVALAYACQAIFAVIPFVQGQGRADLQAGAALDLGELFAVLAAPVFFSAIAIPHGEWRCRRRWILPGALFLLFSAANVADMVANQGFTGVFTIWSTGMRLYLPWPLYAVGLAVFTYAVLTCFSKSAPRSEYANSGVGLGLLLLLFAGYRLLTPYQFILAVTSVVLLSGFARPFATQAREYEVRDEHIMLQAAAAKSSVVSD